MFQRSTLTFGNAKQRVAARSGKTTADQLILAGRSIQDAIKYYNSIANWKWLATTAEVSVTSGNVGTLPWNFKDIYQLEADTDGYTRPLDGLDRRVYRRAAWTRVADNPIAYDLFLADSGGQFELIPPPGEAKTLELAYYRNMVVPCTKTIDDVGTADNVAGVDADMSDVYVGNTVTVYTSGGALALQSTITSITNEAGASTADEATATTAGDGTGTIGGDGAFLDIPAELERGILAFAIHDFMSSIGAPENRLTYWMRAADDELTRALAKNGPRWEDMDLAILPASLHTVNLNPVPNNVLG